MFIPFCLESLTMSKSFIMSMDYFYNEGKKNNIAVFCRGRDSEEGKKDSWECLSPGKG